MWILDIRDCNLLGEKNNIELLKENEFAIETLLSMISFSILEASM